MSKIHNLTTADHIDRKSWMHRYYMARSRRMAIVRRFWDVVNNSEWESLPDFFIEDAQVDWVCTAERFTVEEFVSIMKNYPGGGRIITLQKMEIIANKATTAVEIRQPQTGDIYHIVAFFSFTADKIRSIEEYRTDGNEIPQWRKDLRVGIPMPAPQSIALRNT